MPEQPFLSPDALVRLVVPRDRRLLALAALKTASEAAAAGDLTAARLFIEDAQAHLREMAKCSSD